MKFRTILVDDEPLALERLQRLLTSHDETIEIVDTASSGAEAIERIEDLRPDLVFLDVQMPELDGFEVLAHLEHMPLVIFSTAHEQYALDAFEVNSIDYLLKPVDPHRLQSAIEKLVRIADGGLVDLRGRVERALRKLERPRSLRVQVQTGSRIKLIPVADVIFFRARDKYVEVHTAEEVHLCNRSLSKLEEEMPPADFVRIHRSILVNVDCIDEIARDGAGHTVLRLRDAERTELPVSRRYRGRLDSL